MVRSVIDLMVVMLGLLGPLGLVALVTRVLVYWEEGRKILGFIDPFLLAVVILLGGICLGGYSMAWLMSLAA